MPTEALPSGARDAILANVARVRGIIDAAALRGGRDPRGVTLVAVTKYVDPLMVVCLHDAGLRDFGESTVQRIASLGSSPLLGGARWHLIGHLQRNKAGRAVELCSSIHSVDSARLAREIATQARKRGLPPPELYVEVNAGSEVQKTGVSPAEAREVLAALRDEGLLPPGEDGGPSGPGVRGLMTMAPRSDEPEDSRPVFRRLREMKDAFVVEGLLRPGAGLSMGMSQDLATAVEEGATSVRVGSILFEGLLAPS
ncbi:MAG TPA: YggS family pyridoxal phosphate-dependent enzyme [Planctomycetota bacterium]|nr:YggS family pyridoxal phosphate-dependent enzyme [Planctomycetota bacterium]